MGLFSKKKPAEPVPRPNPPFMPTQPTSDSMSLKDQLSLDQEASPTELPPLPTDVSDQMTGSLDNVSNKMDNINDRLNQIESPLPAPQQMQISSKPGAKVFIRLDKYTEIINTINTMESKINELKNALTKINDLRNSEQQLVDSWNKLVDEAQAKVNDVSSKLPPANR